MQIVQLYNRDFISEVALQCGDTQYNDFNENIYAQCAFRAQREVAKEYEILEKEVVFTTETSDWEILPLKNFRAEYKVLKNGVQMTKNKNWKFDTTDMHSQETTAPVGWLTDTVPENELPVFHPEYTDKTHVETVCYYDIKYDEKAQWVINYVDKKADDEITIYYISTGPDASETDGTPIVPDKYYEDMVNRATILICKLGIAKYLGEKKQKYMDIYKINIKPQHDTRLTKDNSWIQIKPFRYP